MDILIIYVTRREGGDFYVDNVVWIVIIFDIIVSFSAISDRISSCVVESGRRTWREVNHQFKLRVRCNPCNVYSLASSDTDSLLSAAAV